MNNGAGYIFQRNPNHKIRMRPLLEWVSRLQSVSKSLIGCWHGNSGLLKLITPALSGTKNELVLHVKLAMHNSKKHTGVKRLGGIFKRPNNFHLATLLIPKKVVAEVGQVRKRCPKRVIRKGA